MTELDKAGLEAAQRAIAKCKAVGRTTLEDHAYEAVTAYLEATEGGEDTPQATDDDLVERLEFVREVLANLSYLSYAADVKAAATRIEQLTDVIAARAALLPDGETEEPARVNHTLNSYIANCRTKGSVNVPRESLESIASSIAAQAAEIAELRRSCGLLVADAEKYRDRIEQLEAEVERHINTAAELRLALDSVLEHYVNMINSVGGGNWTPETKPKGIASGDTLADTPEGK